MKGINMANFKEAKLTNNEMVVDNAWSLVIPPFTKEDNPHGLVAESSFATLFPKYREKYIKESFPVLKAALREYGIVAQVDLVEGSMFVRTTKKVWDPYIILKAKDAIKLLARSVPIEQAVRVLKDDVGCDIIKISGMVSNKEKFVKRRERIVGAGGSTLKAIELLTNCYVLVQGHTVASVGPYKGLVEVRRIVEGAMRNEHPIFKIKTLMIKSELAKDPKLKNEDWSRFLPKFESKNVKRKKPKIRNRKPYTPFPPPQPESKVDKELATGEYFLKEHERRARKMALKEERKSQAEKVRQEKRNSSFIPPDESEMIRKKPKHEDDKIDIKAFKKKIKASQMKKAKLDQRLQQTETNEGPI